MLDTDISNHKIALLHPAGRFDSPDMKLAWRQFQGSRGRFDGISTFDLLSIRLGLQP